MFPVLQDSASITVWVLLSTLWLAEVGLNGQVCHSHRGFWGCAVEGWRGRTVCRQTPRVSRHSTYDVALVDGIWGLKVNKLACHFCNKKKIVSVMFFYFFYHLSDEAYVNKKLSKTESHSVVSKRFLSRGEVRLEAN